MRIYALALVVAALVGLAGVFAYSTFRAPQEASAPIESVAVTPSNAAPDTASARVYEIQPEQSQARFIIDEILQGSPKTVVGTTNQVAGQIAVDPADLDPAQVGPILINARTFTTDSNSRNRMIQNQILQTDAHEYISFQPKHLVGLPTGSALAQSTPLQIVGDLTIRGVTREVTFDASVTPQSADRLQGKAATTIRYADWGISIPQVPSVAGVSEQVQLQIDFVAASA
jgi:polyisoprenoid-binding protein YceI